MAGAYVSQASPAGQRVRGPRMAHSDTSSCNSKVIRRSQRIAKRQRSSCAEIKRQQNSLSPPPKRPLRKTPSSHARNPRIQNTKNSQPTPTTPQLKDSQPTLTSRQLKRKRLDEAVASQTSPNPPRKRIRVSPAEKRENFDQDQASASNDLQSVRVRYWSEQGTWPSEAAERAMQSFRGNYPSDALAKRRTSQLGRKRSSGSFNADTISSDDQKPLSEKNSYRDEQVVIELKNFGSFMDDHEEGITPESAELCRKLLNNPQKMPEGTLFSDELFPGLCKMVKGENEATVVRYILPELVPSPKIRALRGAKHLKILNETINASWINATECCDRRPKPDYSIGIAREAFSPKQLQNLRPFIATQLKEESHFTATYDTCFPFFTTEVKCGATALDIADRQNALSQTIGLRALVTLFRLVNREQELHRKVLGLSISHDNEAVRIYGHYPFIDGKKTTYHRCVISTFNIIPTMEGDKRWKTPTFVLNVHDWAVEHFKMICSAIDMLQVEAESSQPSGLSQQLEGSEIVDELPTGDTPITPDASTHTGERKKKRTAGTSNS